MTAIAQGDGFATVPAAPPRAGLSLWGIGILLAMANFLAVLDVSIANVSVPTIAGNLGASSSQGTWVITSYAVAEAIMVPLTGWLANRFGAVRVFITAMLGFGFFSAMCGLSGSLGMLVFFRILQGFCGGPLMPLSQTLLLRIFPKEKHASAMGLWAMTTLTAPIAGPMLGGILCDNLGWASIFWVNVPIAALCAPVLYGMLKKHETETMRVRVDVVGLMLLVLFVGSLQLMLDLGKEHDWFESSLIWWLAVIAAIGFGLFMIWELTERDPIVNLRIFRHRGFAAACLTLPLAFGAFQASNVLIPQWLQLNMGYTATWAGYISGMTGVLAVVGAPIAARLSGRFDPRILIFGGVMWLAYVTFMRAGATSQMDFWEIAWWPLIIGIGVPMFFLPLNMVGLGSVDPEETASAAGLLNFIRTMAGAVATSMVNTLWENNATRNQAELAGALNDPEATLALMQQSGLSYDQAVSTLTSNVQSQAVVMGTNQLMTLCAVGFAVAALTIWLAPRPRAGVDVSAVH
ncbi:MAG TPA: DHA2 family efflux MFS transporter permease subunit [Allosphingosinicella sp.]|nr:DHA2 family efflux MFS transporter permease subunit [Allosphingosinicella sp.]